MVGSLILSPCLLDGGLVLESNSFRFVFCCERLSASMARSLHLSFICIPQSTRALDQGGVEPRQAVSPKALRPWTIPLRYSVGSNSFRFVDDGSESLALSDWEVLNKPVEQAAEMFQQSGSSCKHFDRCGLCGSKLSGKSSDLNAAS